MFTFFFNNIEEKESKKEKKTLCRKNALVGKKKGSVFSNRYAIAGLRIKKNKEVFLQPLRYCRIMEENGKYYPQTTQ